MMEPKHCEKNAQLQTESEVKKVKRELGSRGGYSERGNLCLSPSLFKIEAHSRLLREPRGGDSNTQPGEPSASARPAMASLCAFLMILVVMNYWSTCSLGCDLSHGHNQGNKSALTHLEEMRRLPPFSCLKDRKHFGFPLEKVDAQQIQKAQAILVLRDLSQQILNLFTSNDSSDAWDAALLESFCNDLHQQLKDLKVCVMQYVGEQEPPLIQENSRMAVRGYFHRITAYLRKKKHSPCAWEVVRVEVWRALSSSANLLARLREEKEGVLRQSVERTLLD